MIMPSIKIDLTVAGIDSVIRKLDALENALKDLSNPVEDLLALGETEATAVLANAHATFPGPRDSTVSSRPSGNRGTVEMSGKGAPFIEFGAGVHYNGNESYPLPRPNGIVGIGEYGQGQGKQDMWQYGHKWTHGNPAQKPLYFAALTMEQNAPAVFKAVIDNALK